MTVFMYVLSRLRQNNVRFKNKQFRIYAQIVDRTVLA